MLVSFSRNRPLEPSIPVAAICEESQEIEDIFIPENIKNDIQKVWFGKVKELA